MLSPDVDDPGPAARCPVNLPASLAELGPVARSHHERFDGTGYPDKLVGTAILVEARIIAVCDAWAQMRASHGRRTAPAVSELRAAGGHEFDPDVVDAFFSWRVPGCLPSPPRRFPR